MVDHLEQMEPHLQETRGVSGDRCVTHWLEHSLLGCQDGRPMFQGGITNAHRLTRVTGSIPGLQMLLQRSREEEHQCLIEYGQHLNSGIH